MKSFFFCYNGSVASYLRHIKGIPFITQAISPKDGQHFWLFEQTEELSQGLRDYKAMREQQKQA
ncbi:hypothetical protein QYF48_15285 [Brevibacillus agri]|uniref:hypothetical protein n=1 Tax=Brevibacillus agri TaxID=51101 RepID=UPI0025B6E83A|nr:hypothetical protein [Brevibacillus agri]MDN4094175.1 hypothetical protein [Brevibacillus agri]